VSEGLLFKHFPHKEAIFTAMQLSCCTEQDIGYFEKLKALEPSASTLVLLVHFLVSRIVGGGAAPDDDKVIQNRLMLRSLAEDGEFARLLLGKAASEWVPKIEECLLAAAKAGEAVVGPVQPRLGAWFTQHLAAMIVLHLLPPTPVVDYGASRTELVEQSVWFTLRGIGLKEEVIERNYNRKVIAGFDD
jgi:AcrR family transcriptional regulator